jgi:hypothetical protein
MAGIVPKGMFLPPSYTIPTNSSLNNVKNTKNNQNGMMPINNLFPITSSSSSSSSSLGPRSNTPGATTKTTLIDAKIGSNNPSFLLPSLRVKTNEMFYKWFSDEQRTEQINEIINYIKKYNRVPKTTDLHTFRVNIPLLLFNLFALLFTVF